MKRCLAISVAAALLMGTPAAADASVRGHVWYSEGQMRAPGVTVTAWKGDKEAGSVLTDSYGYFVLSLPAGTYTLKAECGAYSWPEDEKTGTITVKDQEILCLPQQISLTGGDSEKESESDMEVLGYKGASQAEIEAAFPGTTYSRAEGSGRPYISDRTGLWFYLTVGGSPEVDQIVLGGSDEKYTLNGITGNADREETVKKLEKEGWEHSEEAGSEVYRKGGLEIVLFGPAGSEKLTSVTSRMVEEDEEQPEEHTEEQTE